MSTRGIYLTAIIYGLMLASVCLLVNLAFSWGVETGAVAVGFFGAWGFAAGAKWRARL